MKTTVCLPLIAVAALMAFSCSKENTNVISKGIPATFTFESPVVEDEDGPDSKIYLFNPSEVGSSGATRPTFRWNTGDIINIISYSIPEDWSEGKFTQWPAFVAQAGGASATFRGEIPDPYVDGYFLILSSKYNQSYTVAKQNDARGRLNIKCNIPALQDGSGINYAIFGARPKYSASDKKFTFEAINDISTNNSNVTAYNNQFALKSALSCFSIPADAHITKVEITVSRSDNATGQYLASNGDKKDIQINSYGFAFSGGGNPTITIYNDGEELPTDIYFASRQAEGKDNQYYPILTFVFTNASGQTATKVLRLMKNNGAEVKNLNCGRLNKLGTVTFEANDFQ